MDGALTPKAGSGRKAVLPVPVGIDAGAGAGRATSSARVARKATLPGAATGAADAPMAATAAPGGENHGGEEEDDEQVERFYALLDNIRAMRGAYMSGYGSVDGAGALDGGVDNTGGGGATVKRLRGSEPPWRPAFRLEDFAEPTPTLSSPDVAAPGAKRTRTRGQEGADGEGRSGGARPDVAEVARVRVRLDSGRKSVV